MLKTLSPLALLALAAVASAQTFSLSPVSESGYVRVDITKSASYGVFASSTKLSPQAALRTRVRVQMGSAFGNIPILHGVGYLQGWYTVRTTTTEGWLAEFALPSAPLGTSLKSATLTVDASGGPQDAAGWIYAGDGVANMADATRIGFATPGTTVPGAVFLDVTGGLRSLLRSGAPYAGFRIYPSSLNTAVSWSSPTLTLTYAPQPVPEPASLLALGAGALALLRRRRA